MGLGRDKKSAVQRNIEERHKIFQDAENGKPYEPKIITPPGDAPLRNELSYTIGRMRIKGQPQEKILRKINRTTPLHRFFGVTAVAAGIFLGLPDKTELPGVQEHSEELAVATLAGSSVLAGLNRFRAMKGVRRTIVNVYPERLRREDEGQAMVERVDRFGAVRQGVTHAGSTALTGSGALLLTAAVNNKDVAGVVDTKTLLVAGGASAVVGLAHFATENIFNVRLGDRASSFMLHAAQQHERGLRPW